MALAGHMVSHSNKLTANKQQQIEKNRRIQEYNQDPKYCKFCGKPLSYEKAQRKQVYCDHSCSASVTNVERTQPKKSRICLNCGEAFEVSESIDKKFCCSKCSADYRSKRCLEIWLSTGEFPNYTGGKYGGANRSNYVMKYLLERQNHQCALCHNEFIWQGHPLPMIVDHIDGNSTNNHPDNLRLLCPNCDATTPTWKGKNKGKGRKAQGFQLPQQRFRKIEV